MKSKLKFHSTITDLWTKDQSTAMEKVSSEQDRHALQLEVTKMDLLDDDEPHFWEVLLTKVGDRMNHLWQNLSHLYRLMNGENKAEDEG